MDLESWKHKMDGAQPVGLYPLALVEVDFPLIASE